MTKNFNQFKVKMTKNFNEIKVKFILQRPTENKKKTTDF